jgi:hypothetical protein
VLRNLNVRVEDVIHTPVFTTDITSFADIAEAHAAFFRRYKTSFYEISKLIASEYLAKIEFKAVLPEK